MVVRTLALCRRRGHDLGTLLRELAIDEATLSAPDARVPYALVEQLSERVFASTGDENFGLHLAQDVEDLGSFDPGMLLLMASATVRVALERMVELQRYWGDGQRATWLPRAGAAAIRYALPGARGAHARHADECMMAEIARGVRLLTEATACPRQVCFRHPAPACTIEHEQLFACPIEFAAPHTEIVYDDAVLDMPMRHANATFCGIFAQQVQRALARLPATCSASHDVRAVVHAALAAGQCTLASTARALGMGTRTLQRRLRDEGTSFAAVVGSLRRELAVAYLEKGLPIAEVAALLGYADTTAFHHAFRRWHGHGPTRLATGSLED
jgi:AraC-like DNA-binding protein